MTMSRVHITAPSTRRRARGPRAQLLCWLLAGLLLPAWAHAQGAPEEPEKAEKTVAVQQAEGQVARPTLDKEGQVGPSEALESASIPARKVDNVRRLDEQIVQLKKLIQSSPKGHPKRAEYMFNLSEMHWDKSKYYEQEAFSKQDQCYKLDDAGKTKDAENCRASMKRMLDESQRLKDEAVHLYVEIYQDYPDFKDLDKVLFYLGTNLQELGRGEESREIFKRLIRDFPNTSFVPNVLLSFGEYYFNEDDVENALRAYQQVAKFKDSEVYGYARYKEAWSYYNMDQKEKALEIFISVIEYSKKHPEFATSAALIKQSRQDIVRTYAHVGNPDKAIPFLKDISNNNEELWLELAERLAIHYADMGNPGYSTNMYRQLIQLRRTSVKTIDYQYEIVRNQTMTNAYDKASVQELVRLLMLVQYADKGEFKDINQAEYTATRDRVESLVREWATQYHREAQKTKNADIYAMAYFLYKNYLDTYPKSDSAYTMTFFYGELLYKLQQWEEAAQAYERALEIDPKGKFTEEAVYAAVLSYFKIVDTSEQGADLKKHSIAQVDDDKKGEEGAPAAIPEPKPMPELLTKFVNALQRYIQYAPEGERIVDVKYNLARTYYDYNHLKEAQELFKDIAYTHSDHRLAVVSANLHLDTLNLLQDFDGLHEAVISYLEKRPITDAEFLETATELNVQIRFKKCTILDEKEVWGEAATCFVDFYRDFPDATDYVDKALYNAALDFERMRDLGKAIRVRVFLLQATPNSPLAPVTLFNIGGNYHALAVYSQAAKFYELFVANFPNHKDAEEALANASEFRYGLGEYPRAIQDYEYYIKQFGKKNPERAAVAHFQIARIHELQNQPKSAMEQYEKFLRQYNDESNFDRILKARTAVGLYYWNLEGPKNRKRALTEFEKTLAFYQRIPDAKKGELTDGRDAAAQAKFMIGQDVYEQMAAISIAAADEKELQKQITKKMEIAQKAHKIFEEVLFFHRPDWTIAALYRIGSQYQNFAETVRHSPIPKRLTYDQKEIYRGLLEDQASQRDDQAVDAYQRALEVALNESWFNEYSKRAEVELAKLRPREYRTPSELRAEPDNLNPGFMRAAFIEQIKDEDRLQDFGQGADGDTDVSEAADGPVAGGA